MRANHYIVFSAKIHWTARTKEAHLVQADVLKLVALEHLQEAEGSVAGILDVMPVRSRDVSCHVRQPSDRVARPV